MYAPARREVRAFFHHALLEETGELLGFGLVNVVNLFNPQAIVVGGGMSAAGERLLGPALSLIHI